VNHQVRERTYQTFLNICVVAIWAIFASSWLVSLSGDSQLLLLALSLSITLAAKFGRERLGLIAEIETGRERLSQSFSALRYYWSSNPILGGLGRAISALAEEQEKEIQRLAQAKREQETVLASMLEGVILIDLSGNIVRVNEAASVLLRLPAETVGKGVEEVLRTSKLQRFIKKCLQNRRSAETDIVLEDNQEKFVRAYARVITDSGGADVALLIVLNDITRLRKLENVRRDFVANVSHELRTPITSIKGFVETLQEGAINNPEDANRFLGIISRQADRLHAIFEDLLSLSRIEQDRSENQIEVAWCKLLDVINSAVSGCDHLSTERNIAIKVVCPEDLHAQINSNLIEQAVFNLLQNALQYSNVGGSIIVKVSRGTNNVIISVQDFGCGIDSRHLPRLFERFYRVDKSRSRAVGGTGLGLAIVKHIAQAHGGTTSVESTLGEGSTFCISLSTGSQQVVNG